MPPAWNLRMDALDRSDRPQVNMTMSLDRILTGSDNYSNNNNNKNSYAFERIWARLLLEPPNAFEWCALELWRHKESIAKKSDARSVRKTLQFVHDFCGHHA